MTADETSQREPCVGRRGGTAVAAVDVAEHLYVVARHHARAAMSTKESGDEFVMLDTAGHVGSAVEFMAKALVARTDVILLTDKPNAAGQLLDVLALLRPVPGVARPIARFTSVKATVALELAGRLHAVCAAHKVAAREALEARNDAAHMGFVEADILHQAVEGMATYIEAGASILGRKPEEFWGSDGYHAAATSVLARRERLRGIADHRITAAKGSYVLNIGQLPEPLRSATITRLSVQLPNCDDYWNEPCPACDNDAWLMWSVDYEAEPDGEGDWNYVGGMALEGLECPVCGLKLDRAEVEALGVDTNDPRDHDWDNL